MIIDSHAHVTGPMELYEYFRGFTNVSGPGAGPQVTAAGAFADVITVARSIVGMAGGGCGG